jgi:Mn2+/Fe2+ NRAMP family transporter
MRERQREELDLERYFRRKRSRRLCAVSWVSSFTGRIFLELAEAAAAAAAVALFRFPSFEDRAAGSRRDGERV